MAREVHRRRRGSCCNIDYLPPPGCIGSLVKLPRQYENATTGNVGAAQVAPQTGVEAEGRVDKHGQTNRKNNFRKASDVATQCITKRRMLECKHC